MNDMERQSKLLTVISGKSYTSQVESGSISERSRVERFAGTQYLCIIQLLTLLARLPNLRSLVDCMILNEKSHLFATHIMIQNHFEIE